MIEFPNAAREFRSLIGRRLELQTLLGSIFAGLGIFLQNTLQGGLPESLGAITRHVFAFYAILMMVPCLILALRMARLHAGMVLNGILIAKLSEGRAFTRPLDTRKAARHNYLGVSFLQFILLDILAGFSTVILVLALHFGVTYALVAGGAIMVVWMGLYFRFHHRAATFALRKIAEEPCADFDEKEWEAHHSGSLEDANSGLNAEVAFVGLVVFSVFETLSGLGQIKTPGKIPGVDLPPDVVLNYGPMAYVGLMLVTCLMGLACYLRIRVAIGKFSLTIDPTDRPFRPFKLTDSLLGYAIIAFLFTVSIHLLLDLLVPAFREDNRPLLVIDALTFLALIAVEQITVVIAARAYRHLERPAGGS